MLLPSPQGLLQDSHTSRLLRLRPPWGFESVARSEPGFKAQSFPWPGHISAHFLPRVHTVTSPSLPTMRLCELSNSAEKKCIVCIQVRLGYLLESLCQTLRRSRDLRKNIASRYRAIQKSILWRQRKRYTVPASAILDKASSWFSLGRSMRYGPLTMQLFRIIIRPSKHTKTLSTTVCLTWHLPIRPLTGHVQSKNVSHCAISKFTVDQTHNSFWLQARFTPYLMILIAK